MDQSFNSQLSSTITQSQLSFLNQQQPTKHPHPLVLESLKPYQYLKHQLFSHFFQNKSLSINNKMYCEAYIKPYELINQAQSTIKIDKIYQKFQVTMLKKYRDDLKQFAVGVYDVLLKKMSQNVEAEQFIKELYRWVNIYVKFNYLIHRIFVVIERISMRHRSISLYFEGLTILKRQILQKLQTKTYNYIFDCLLKFKQNTLKSIQELQIVIKYYGIIGFTKIKQITITKIDSRFQYTSSKHSQGQIIQKAFSTKLFLSSFIDYMINMLIKYHHQKIEQIIQLSSLEYLLYANKWIYNQQEVISHFYNTNKIKDKIISTLCQMIIVEKSQNVMKRCIGQMIGALNYQHLGLVYRLYKKSNIIKKFYGQFQHYIQTQGEKIILPLVQNHSIKRQTIQVINSIIKLYTNIQTIKTYINPHDLQFQISINFGFQYFCNKDNNIYSALAHYIDMTIKKEQLSNDKLQELIALIQKISKYFYCYDYFIKIHQKLLSLRLLYYQDNRTAQYAIINLIKNQAGVNAAYKLTNMITDIEMSQDWNNDFQLKNKHGFSFQVIMLTGSSWEISSKKVGRSLVPACLKKAVEQYQSRFFFKMPNRHIDWIFTHGRGIIQLVSSQNKKYKIFLNNYQLMAILYMQQKNYKSSTYVQLLYNLKIEDEIFFKHSLLSLLKNDIIIKMDNFDDEAMNQININFDIKSKNQKISCCIFPKYYQKVSVINNELSIERNILIDAILIKLMKQRKRQLYNQIINQVIKLCKIFKAEVNQIKLRIQNCIQRQFLERDSKDFNVLVYKP